MAISFFGTGPITTADLDRATGVTETVEDTQINEESAPSEEDAGVVVGIMETEESAPPPVEDEEYLSITDRPDFWEETGLDRSTDPVTQEELDLADERELFETVNEPIGAIIIAEARRDAAGDVVESFPEEDTGRLESMGRTYAGTCESIVGTDVLNAEKPYVIATLAQRIEGGFSKSNVVFIRKFLSLRGRAESYKVLRKRAFYSGDFVEVGSMPGANNVFPEKYNKYLESLRVPKHNILVFEDMDINPTEVYIYLIKVKWNLKTPEELASDAELLFRAGAELGTRFVVEFGESG